MDAQHECAKYGHPPHEPGMCPEGERFTCECGEAERKQMDNERVVVNFTWEHERNASVQAATPEPELRVEATGD